MIEAAQAILLAATGRSGWQVAATEYGTVGASYLASRQCQRLVLKFIALPPGLERLSELGVTPRLLDYGEYQGRSWVLQEYMAGDHPNSSWFCDHLPALARVLRRYHEDWPLRSLLLQDPGIVHAQNLALADEELRRAREILDGVASEVAGAPGAFDLYEGQMVALDLCSEVPVHADPNRKNVIVAGDGFYLIDWDGICLSDPLADAGVMLWWYVPAEQWSEFFAAYGMELNQAALDRLYWWTARRSLQVAMWAVEHGKPEAARDFLIDFVAAACHRANPHWRP